MPNKFKGCIADALAKAATEGEQAALRDADATYDEAYATHAQTLGPAEADRAAGAAVMADLSAKALRQKQLRALSLRSRRDLLSGIAELKRRRGYENVQDLGAGGKPPEGGWVQGGEPPAGGPHAKGAIAARALELLVEGKPGLAGAPFPSIEGRYRAVRGSLDAMMADVIEKFESKTALGAPNRATLENLVREAKGEASGDAAAKDLAAAFDAAAEHVRQLFNAAGGGIGKIEHWFPQHHDPLKIRAAGKATWIEGIYPRLDRQQMIDRVTGLPFSEKRLRATLSEIYDTIASGGANKREPGEQLGRGMLAEQRKDERFLQFKSADDWLAYNAEYGAGDPFGIMLGHLDEMSRDVAQMQILGPNPEHQWRWLRAFAQREAALEQAGGREGAVGKARNHLRTSQDMLDHFTGAANVPEKEWLARTGATLRAILTPAALGSAILSDLPSSPVFGAYARTMAGLSTVGHMDQLVALMASPAARANARRSGFVIEQATDALVKGAQDGLRLQTVGNKVDAQGLNVLARRMPAAVFRLSGLSGWTAARKRAFRLEFMGALADRAGRTMDEIAAGDGEDRALAEVMQAQGIDAATWDKLRQAELWSPDGESRFLRPVEAIAADPEAGYRLAELIELQTRQAVPETTVWTRAKLLGQDHPGSVAGEFRRSWAMFRSFTATATHLYVEDMFLRGQDGPWAGAKLAAAAAGLVGALTVSGAVSIQLRELAKGNNPRDMGKASFWGAAFMQGGGFGIFGDFLYAAQNRIGKSSALTAFGPTAAALSDLYDATGGLATDVAGRMEKGDDFGTALDKAHPGRRAVTLLRRYNPLASLWWARAAMDRAVMDQLQRMVDPDADAAFRRRAKQLKKDYGETQYWPQGAAAPTSAPDLSTAFGDGR